MDTNFIEKYVKKLKQYLKKQNN